MLPDKERGENPERIGGKDVTISQVCSGSLLLLQLGCPTLPPLAFSWPWLGCACHGSEAQGRSVDQRKFSDSLFYAGFGVS